MLPLEKKLINTELILCIGLVEMRCIEPAEMRCIELVEMRCNRKLSMIYELSEANNRCALKAARNAVYWGSAYLHLIDLHKFFHDWFCFF